MKKSNLIIKSLVVMFALFMVSCNDDDGFQCPDPLTGELNATEADFAGSWVFSGMVAEDEIDLTDDDKDNPSKDIFAQYTPCDRDLAYEFKNDRNYSLKQGYLALDCNNKQSLVGTWSLTAANSLTFVASCALQTVNIEMSEEGDAFSYTSNLSFKDVDNAVKTTKVTFTYSKVSEEVNPQ